MDNQEFRVAESQSVERKVEERNTLRNAPAADRGDVSSAIEDRNGKAYPKGSPHSVKHIAFLYAYCRKSPFDIVARYPKTISHSQVHIALAHYYLHQEAVDAEIEQDIKLNRPDVLAGDALPRLRLDALVQVGQEIESLEAKVSLRSVDSGLSVQSHRRTQVKTSK
jgi:hypothetical protein